MVKQLQFTDRVARQLRHYVYRLIDPRTGMTFYVGRGQGNRVFAHAGGKKPANVESNDAKMELIVAIRNAGFDVQHVVHRHGLGEEAAREVEAALIDAYPGLTNRQSGYDSSRGVMRAEEVIRLYAAPEVQFQHKLLLINVSRSSEERELYDAVRYCWKISPTNARACDYVLAVRGGLVAGVFEAEAWLPATEENFPSFPPVEDRRFGFVGHEAPADVREFYLHKRVPDRLRRRGAANPIRYVDVPIGT